MVWSFKTTCLLVSLSRQLWIFSSQEVIDLLMIFVSITGDEADLVRSSPSLPVAEPRFSIKELEPPRTHEYTPREFLSSERCRHRSCRLARVSSGLGKGSESRSQQARTDRVSKRLRGKEAQSCPTNRKSRLKLRISSAIFVAAWTIPLSLTNTGSRKRCYPSS